jgi:hypothetical protein
MRNWQRWQRMTDEERAAARAHFREHRERRER